MFWRFIVVVLYKFGNYLILYPLITPPSLVNSFAKVIYEKLYITYHQVCGWCKFTCICIRRFVEVRFAIILSQMVPTCEMGYKVKSFHER